jgi:hypothetical protein
MASPRGFDSLKREMSTQFFDELLKNGVSDRASAISDTLGQMKNLAPLNPGRPQPFMWDDKNLSEEIKNILVISVALDEKYSAAYADIETELKRSITTLQNNQYSIVSLEMNLADKLLTEHVKLETSDVQYHRDPHPKESAVLASKIEIINQNGQKSSPEEQARAASAFAVHDAEYGEMQEGLNEINSAALLYHAKLTRYSQLQSQIVRDVNLNADIKISALNAINDYISLLPYEAWKTIVAGTTMMKKVDGQPTVFTAQKLGVEVMLGKKAQVGNALDRQTMIMSMIDSNFAAFTKQLQQDAVLSQHLPSSLLTNIPVTVQAILFNPKGDSLERLTADKTLVDMTGLLYGQNERMFPEIHAAYKAALFKSRFNVANEAGQMVSMDGVSLWNKAMEAARNGDMERLDHYLSAGTTAQIDIAPFPPTAAAPPPILVGSTLQDIFIHRIGGEIQFAKGQGPELYQHLSDKLGFKHPDIDYKLWSAHVLQLENLKERYESATPQIKVEISKALFHIASHQPGVYLDCDKRLQHIGDAITDLGTLDKSREALQDQDDSLEVKIFELEEDIKMLKSTTNADASSKAKESSLKSSTNSIAQGLLVACGGATQILISQKTTELQVTKSEHSMVKHELSSVTKALESRQKQESNLLRAQAELEKTSAAIKPVQEAKSSVAYKA